MGCMNYQPSVLYLLLGGATLHEQQQNCWVTQTSGFYPEESSESAGIHWLNNWCRDYS